MKKNNTTTATQANTTESAASTAFLTDEIVKNIKDVSVKYKTAETFIKYATADKVGLDGIDADAYKSIIELAYEHNFVATVIRRELRFLDPKGAVTFGDEESTVTTVEATAQTEPATATESATAQTEPDAAVDPITTRVMLIDSILDWIVSDKFHNTFNRIMKILSVDDDTTVIADTIVTIVRRNRRIIDNVIGLQTEEIMERFNDIESVVRLANNTKSIKKVISVIADYLASKGFDVSTAELRTLIKECLRIVPDIDITDNTVKELTAILITDVGININEVAETLESLGVESEVLNAIIGFVHAQEVEEVEEPILSEADKHYARAKEIVLDLRAKGIDDYTDPWTSYVLGL